MPSTAICSGSPASTGAITSSTSSPRGWISALALAKNTSSATTAATRPRSVIRKRTWSPRPLASRAASRAAWISTSRSSSASAASTRAWAWRALSSPRSPPPSTRSTGAGAASTSSWAGFGTLPLLLSMPVPPSTGIAELAPNPSARPLLSCTNFCWSTWLIANSTMNSAISTVIMSA